MKQKFSFTLLVFVICECYFDKLSIVSFRPSKYVRPRSWRILLFTCEWWLQVGSNRGTDGSWQHLELSWLTIGQWPTQLICQFGVGISCSVQHTNKPNRSGLNMLHVSGEKTTFEESLATSFAEILQTYFLSSQICLQRSGIRLWEAFERHGVPGLCEWKNGPFIGSGNSKAGNGYRLDS